ncbi:GPP34 family phosphoprotein [Streptomyces sp. NPDC048111]|uniref:GOLPH3/VPS74 family protein n=1 Tax=Streptomyces sp. NPDC048111 TaxID=3365500 RepID=UPI00371694FC
MTTARDLLIVSMDTTTGAHSVGQGDLSLALAGAELLDLADAFALTLDGDRIVPGPPQSGLNDRQLSQAAAALVRQEPYESVEDWLWRRGRGLYAEYLAALETDGGVTREQHRWIPLRSGRAAVTDSPDRRAAVERWTSGEPVLAALAVAARLRDQASEGPQGPEGSEGPEGPGRPEEFEGLEGFDRPEGPEALAALAGDTVVTVVTAVDDAVTELAAVRQRRSIEDAAFDNIWRGQ